MSEFTALLNEYKNLKQEIFGNSKFVILDETSERVKRYNQLLAFFYPQFRTKDWVSPV